MKKKVCRVFCILVLSMLTLNLTGCSFIDGFKEGYNSAKKNAETKVNNKVVKSSDETCQITVPGTWKETTGLNDKAIIQAANSSKDIYTICIPYDKSDFDSGEKVADFAKLTQQEMQTSVKNYKISNESSITMNNTASTYYEVQGQVQNLNVTYFAGITEGKDKFYEVISYCLTSKTDANRSTFKSILASFKELNS